MNPFYGGMLDQLVNAEAFNQAINVIANKYLNSKKYPFLISLPENSTEEMAS